MEYYSFGSAHPCCWAGWNVVSQCSVTRGTKLANTFRASIRTSILNGPTVRVCQGPPSSDESPERRKSRGTTSTRASISNKQG